MSLTRLNIEDVRNLHHVDIEPIDRLNIIAGRNGSGKTSLLESIYLLSYASSFRSHNKHGLINFKAERLVVGGTVTGDSNPSIRIGLEISNYGKVTNIRANGNRVAKASDLSRLVPLTVISPEDHRIFELGPRYRRRFLDWGVFHVEPNYTELWREYHHLLRQRNAALKRSESVAAWDPLLSQRAEALTAFRTSYLSSLTKKLRELLTDSSSFHDVELRLQRGWPSEQSYLEHLERTQSGDRVVRTTQSGPHKADIVIEVSGRPARTFLSRGQTKLLICFLRLAQASLRMEKTTQQCIVLADDLAAELDVPARAIVLEMLYNSGLQLFLTATSASDFEFAPLTRVRVFHVEHGQVSPLSLPTGASK